MDKFLVKKPAAAASALNDAAVPSTTNKSKAEAAVPSTAKKPKVAEKKAADKPPALKNSTNEPSPAAVVKEAPPSSDVASSSEAISALKKVIIINSLTAHDGHDPQVLSKAGTPQVRHCLACHGLGLIPGRQELAKKLATALATDPVAVPELCNTIADIVNEVNVSSHGCNTINICTVRMLLSFYCPRGHHGTLRHAT